MFDHIGIGVTNLKQSKDFFAKSLSPVGMEHLGTSIWTPAAAAARAKRVINGLAMGGSFPAL